jgi:hypothetical protein
MDRVENRTTISSDYLYAQRNNSFTACRYEPAINKFSLRLEGTMRSQLNLAVAPFTPLGVSAMRTARSHGGK